MNIADLKPGIIVRGPMLPEPIDVGWKLARSRSALCPSGTDEKRWVDGVPARKKGLGS